MSRTCPRCPPTVLETIELHGETLDHCPGCQGLYFDRFELSQAIRARYGLPRTYRVGKSFGPIVAEKSIVCPGCLDTMQEMHLLKDYYLPVDFCEACGGVWVDGDEVGQVLSTPRLQQALARLSEGFSVQGWFFEFLTRLPVEYNIPPRRFPAMTFSLIAVNVTVFLIGLLDAGARSVIVENLAAFSTPIKEGLRLWTLISHQFVHGGWLHLIANMYFLWIIGDNVEDAVGRGRFLAFYLMCGVGGALFEIAFAKPVIHPLLGPIDVPMVGASGAIAGLFAMYMAWFRHASLTFMFVVWQKKLRPIWYFGGWLILMNVVPLVSGTRGDIAFLAHIGGFVVGAFIGVLMRRRVRDSHPLLRLMQEDGVRVSR